MRRVALTGGIATGKSTVARLLQAHQLRLVSADDLARHAVRPGTAMLAQVVARFGAGVLTADGTLERGALGRMVFADSGARRDLEDLIHPEVRRGIEQFFDGLPRDAIGVAEIPLLFESDRAHAFDDVVVTVCAPSVQRRRLAARDGLAQPEIDARIAAQWPTEDKARLADALIVTDGSLDDTARQVAELVAWFGVRNR